MSEVTPTISPASTIPELNANLDKLYRSIVSGLEQNNNHFAVIKSGLDKAHDGIVKNTSRIKAIEAAQVNISQSHTELEAKVKELTNTVNTLQTKVNEDQLQRRHSEMVAQTEKETRSFRIYPLEDNCLPGLTKNAVSRRGLTSTLMFSFNSIVKSYSSIPSIAPSLTFLKNSLQHNSLIESAWIDRQRPDGKSSVGINITCTSATAVKNLKKVLNHHLKSAKSASKVFSAFVRNKDASLNNKTINATMSQFTRLQDNRSLIQFHIAYRQVTKVQGIPRILPKILVRVNKKKSGTLVFDPSKRSETIFSEKFSEESGTHLTMNLLPIRPKSVQPDGNIILRATDLVSQLITLCEHKDANFSSQHNSRLKQIQEWALAYDKNLSPHPSPSSMAHSSDQAMETVDNNTTELDKHHDTIINYHSCPGQNDDGNPTLFDINSSNRAERHAAMMHQNEYLARSELNNMYSEEFREARMANIDPTSNTSTPKRPTPPSPSSPSQEAWPQRKKPNNPIPS